MDFWFVILTHGLVWVVFFFFSNKYRSKGKAKNVITEEPNTCARGNLVPAARYP